MIVLPVAAVDQTTVPPVQAVAVKVTEPFSQIEVAPSILIVGGLGFSFTSTVTVPVVVHWSFDTTIVYTPSAANVTLLIVTILPD